MHKHHREKRALCKVAQSRTENSNNISLKKSTSDTLLLRTYKQSYSVHTLTTATPGCWAVAYAEPQVHNMSLQRTQKVPGAKKSFVSGGLSLSWFSSLMSRAQEAHGKRGSGLTEMHLALIFACPRV